MASPNINVLMSLVDKFTAPMKKVSASVKSTEKELKLAQNSVASFGKSLNDAFLNISGMAIAGIGAGFAAAAAGVGALAVESMQLADAQIKAETMLKQALSNVESIKNGEAGALENAYNELTKYAGALQETGVIGDEVTLMGMKQLATFQLSGETIKTLSKGMLDLAVNAKGLNVTQEDMVNFGNLMGKAMQGNVGALSRYGISMSEEQKNLIKFGDEEQRAAVLAQVLQENVGGMNESMAKTDQGKVQHAMNAYGDMLEEFGKKLNPLKATIYSAFEGLLPQIQSSIMPVLDQLGAIFTDKLAPKITAGMGVLVQYLPGIVSMVINTISFIVEHVGDLISVLDALSPVLAGIVAGFMAFNAISGVLAMVATVVAWVTKLKLILAGCSTAMAVFNALMLANPVAMTAVAIGALVAALVLLYKNWDTVTEYAMIAWDALKSFCNYLIGTALEVWDIYVQTITDYISILKTIFMGIIDFVVNVFNGDWEGAWNVVVETFSTVFSKIKEIAMRPLEWISNKVSSIADAVSNISFGGGGGAEKHNALGSSYFPGGSTYINEGNRGELVNLPNGSQIVPHDLAVKAVGQAGQTVNINLTVQGNVIGNEDFYNQCGQVITQKLQIALANM